MIHPKASALMKHGFTLIELLVVIAIIALLVSILTPSLQNAKDLARDSVCRAKLGHIRVALSSYWQENNRLMPASAYSRDENGDYIGWYRILYWPYGLWTHAGLEFKEEWTKEEWNEAIRNTEHFNCPLAIERCVWLQPDHPNTHPSSWYGQEDQVGGCSYAMNHFISYPPTRSRYAPVDAYDDPGNTGVLLDSTKGALFFSNSSSYHCVSCTNCHNPRHLGRINALLLDGGVRAAPFSAFTDMETGFNTPEALYTWGNHADRPE